MTSSRLTLPLVVVLGLGLAHSAQGQVRSTLSPAAEVQKTKELNRGIVAGNEAADREDAANSAAFEAARSQHKSTVEHAEAERRSHEEALLRHDETRLAHEQAMADWRATVAACERGDRVRCHAGQTRPLPRD